MSGTRTREQRIEENTKGASLAGSTSRSEAMGVGDPRHRRGAQAEGMSSLRFDTDDFEVDSNQRLKLRARPIPPQALACEISSANESTTPALGSSLSKMGLEAAASSTGTYIAVDATNDNIQVTGGSAYMVEAQLTFYNTSTSSPHNVTLAIVGTDGTVYATQTQAAIRKTSGTGVTAGPARHDIWLAGVVDRLDGGGTNIEVQAAVANDAVDVAGGWARVHRLT